MDKDGNMTIYAKGDVTVTAVGNVNVNGTQVVVNGEIVRINS